MNANLKAELIEVFTGQISSNVRFTFNALIQSFGPSLEGVYNSRQYRVWSETVRPCCERSGGNRVGGTYSLNDDKLAAFAAKLSDLLADEVLAKVNAKVGQLENAQAVRVGGANFVINGMKGERMVQIVQNQIINVSVKGKLFNQYPSRIYVDGKFIPATKFASI